MDEQFLDAETEQIELRLRKKFARRNGVNKAWAEEDAQGSDDESLMRSSSVMGHSGRGIPSGIITIEKLPDANREHPSKNGVKAIKYHPLNPLLMVAGNDRFIRLFQVDGVKNPLVHQVLSPYGVLSANYYDDATRILFCGNSPNFFDYDIRSGSVSEYKDHNLAQKTDKWQHITPSTDGQYLALQCKNSSGISLVSTKTKRWIRDLTIGSDMIAKCVFSKDGTQLACASKTGMIYRWDMRTMRCLDRSNDSHQLTTCLQISNTGNYMATGADNGIVNVYRAPELGKSLGQPIKTLDNLVQSVHGLAFSHDDQILATYSDKDRGLLRLFHTETLTAYSNWPNKDTSVGLVSCLDFSANSGYLSVGFTGGRVSLYRLPHYQKA